MRVAKSGIHAVAIDALGARSLVLTSVGLCLAYVVGSPGLWGRNPAAWLASILLAATAMFVVILLLSLASQRVRYDLPWPLAFVLSSACFALTLGWSYQLLGVDPEPGWAMLLPIGMVLSFFVLMLATSHARAVRIHRGVIQDLATESHGLGRARREMDEMRRAWGIDTRSRIRESIRQALSRVRDVPLREAPELLRQLAEHSVRPFSHEMAQPARLPEPSPAPPIGTSKPDYVHLLAATSIPAMPFAALALISSALLGIGLYGAAAGAGFAVLVAIGAMGAARVASEIGRRWNERADWAALILRIAFLAAAVAAVLYIAASLTGRAAFEDVPPLATPLFVILGMSAALNAGIRDHRQRLELELASVVEQRRWEVARANEEFYADRMHVARVTHGPIQAALTAGAIRLDQAIEQGPADLLEDAGPDRELTETMERVWDAVSQLDRHPFIDLARMLEQVRRTWDGACDVAVTGDPAALRTNDAVAGTILRDLISEAIANSVRHGRATKVTVKLQTEGRVVTLIVADNGVPARATGPRGLGTETLDDVTIHWTRETGPAGSTLVAVLPWTSAARHD